MSSEQQGLKAAYLLHQQQKFSQAKKAYQVFLKNYPDNEEAWHLLGLLLLQLNDNEAAIYALNKAVTLSPNTAAYHTNLAQALKRLNKFDQAIEELTLSIELEPQNASALNNLGSLYQTQKQLDKALRFYIKATHAAPSFMPAHENLAKLLIQLGYLPEAKKQCENILALDEDSYIGHYLLANLLLNEEKLEKAKKHYHQILQYYPQNTDCLNNLGTIALKQDNPQLAIDYYTKALAFDNDSVEARNNLAATFMQYDRYENAINHYQELLRIEPLNQEYHFNLGVAQMNLGHLDDAIYHFEQVLKQDPYHAASFINLAAIANRQENKRKAKSYLEQALKIDPYDETSNYMLKALKGEHLKKAPKGYIKNLFDNYAIQYDKHLTETLAYNIPNEIEQFLKTVLIDKEQALNCLDLGCGTGLCGYVLKPYSKYLIGVDLSPKMLEIATKKDLYDKLVEKDLMYYLTQCEKTFDVIVAAEVFNYFGELESLLKLINQCMNPYGLMIFSIEICKKSAFTLQKNARFAHAPQYIAEIAHKLGLKIILNKTIKARKEKDRFINAQLFCLEKNLV